MRLLFIFLFCFRVSAGLIDSNATEQTKEMYQKLLDAQGNYIYYGEFLAYGRDSRIDTYKITGSYPAVYSFDYDCTADSSLKFPHHKQQIIEHYNRGGIITISWHMVNFSTGGTCKDLTGSTVPNILPDGSNRAAYLSYLDKFARDIKKIKIPIIFRPFHENDIGAFWWGKDSCTPEQFIALWRDLVVYMRDVKDVHNLLYCYSPEILTGEYKGERFPGKNYVDIYAIDNYSNSDDISAVITRYGKASDAAVEDGKVFGVSEGLRKLTDYPKADFWTWYFNQILADPKASRAAFVCTWSSPNWGCQKGRSDEADFLEMSQNPRIRFLQYRRGIFLSGVTF